MSETSGAEPGPVRTRAQQAVPVAITAHRGWSGRWPEMTLAAYRAAIGWSAETGVPLGLECDVHFSADDQLICLHDLTVDRTADSTGPAYARTVTELRDLDFAAGRRARPRRGDRRFTDPQASALVTLAELLDLVAAARGSGADVSVVIETKHPNPRGTDIEQRVADELRAREWAGPGAPARIISFSAPALEVAAALVPDVGRTFLIEKDFGPWVDGHLPDGIDRCGVDLELIRTDPAYVDRARRHGNGVEVWTVNRSDDIDLCLDLGVVGLTTDHPDRVLAALVARGGSWPGTRAPG